MAQLLIRKLDESLKDDLRRRAKLHGVSMEQEARRILQDELQPRPQEGEVGLGTRIAALFRDIPDNDEPFEVPLRGSLRIPDFSK